MNKIDEYCKRQRQINQEFMRDMIRIGTDTKTNPFFLLNQLDKLKSNFEKESK